MRCKMKLIEKTECGVYTTKDPNGTGLRVRLVPVQASEDDPESATYSGATPTGDVSLTICNPAAIEELRKLPVNSKVYLDLSWPTN